MDIDVLVIADARGEAMLPLTQRTCPALLPICGRSTIDHVLELLNPLPLNRLQILIGGFSAQVRQFAGNGERWGVDIEYVATRGNSITVETIHQEARNRDKPCLVIDTSIFCTFDILAAVERFASQDEYFLQAVDGDQKSGVYYFDPAKRSDDSPVASAAKAVPIKMDICQDITTLESYHQLNLMIARDRPDSVMTRGQEKFEGVIAGPGCVIESDNLDNCQLFAGIGCQLHPDVRCRGTVVLGDNVVVDRNTTIVNSLILDKTFISEQLHIENAIIWRNNLIRIDINTSVTLEDDRLLGSLSNSAISSTIGSAVGRTTALIVLILSLPLWVVALFDAGLNNGFRLFRSTRYYGNPKQTHQSHLEFKGVEIKSRFKLLAGLPILFDMVRGRVNWFGVSVCRPELLTDREESWQFMRDDHPVGLLGPAQLELDDYCGIDAVLMADATFPGCTRRGLLKTGIKTLFCMGQAFELQSKLSSK